MSALAPRQQAILTVASERLRPLMSALPGDTAQWGLIHGDLHRDNILLHNGEVAVIDFDDCGPGYYMLDLVSVLDSFYRRVIARPADYPPLREAYLSGYARVRALPADLDMQLRNAKVMRDMVTANFVLTSKNASVQTWGRQRVEHIVAQVEAYLEDSPALEI